MPQGRTPGSGESTLGLLEEPHAHAQVTRPRRDPFQPRRQQRPLRARRPPRPQARPAQGCSQAPSPQHPGLEGDRGYEGEPAPRQQAQGSVRGRVTQLPKRRLNNHEPRPSGVLFLVIVELTTGMTGTGPEARIGASPMDLSTACPQAVGGWSPPTQTY